MIYEIWHGPPGNLPLRWNTRDGLMFTPQARNAKEVGAAVEILVDRHPHWRVTIDPIDDELLKPKKP